MPVIKEDNIVRKMEESVMKSAHPIIKRCVTDE